MTDENLARRARGGDTEAYMELAHRHRHHVYRLAYRFAGTVEDAEDLSQQCLIRAFRQIGKFDPERPFGNWLLRLSTNVCLNWSDGRRRARTMETSLHNETPDPADFERQTLDGMERKAVLAALEALSPDTRHLVILRFVLGYTFREIGEIRGMTLQSAAHRISRGLEELRAKLPEESREC
ncbi:MAG: RNA polymerase sigma factor [Fimbriimonas ginsengisoli]|uniref:RNA polymerase sigma factor n=1 Tax=Fimbriimonas ginsengisoli TaxID=1005039 RepID=A0A931LS31_FIMGI|nr:RNA polymerase sigma factor [Fimbriimonas ginsengisoli]